MNKRRLFKVTNKTALLNESVLVYTYTPQMAKECFDSPETPTVSQPSILERIAARQSASTEDIRIFFKNFYRFFRIGTSPIDILKICVSMTSSALFKGILCEMAYKMRHTGEDMATIIQRHYADIFGQNTAAIIRSAQISGKADGMFKVLSQRAEASHRLKKQLRSALTYPVLMLTLSIVIVCGMLLFVIPTVSNSFINMKMEIPAITQFFMTLSDILRHQTWLLITVLAMPFVAIYALKKNFHSKITQYLLTKSPFISPLIKDLSLLDGLRALSMSISSGIDMVESHKLASETASLLLHKKYFSSLEQQIRSGKDLYSSYKQAEPIIGTTGHSVAVLVKTGIRSNCLNEVIAELVTNLEEDASAKAALLPKLLQPVFTIIIFCIIGAMAAAVYIPQIQMILQAIEQ